MLLRYLGPKAREMVDRFCAAAHWPQASITKALLSSTALGPNLQHWYQDDAIEMAREMERQVKDAMDHCLEKLANRCAVVDAGKDHAAFPREGLCFLRVTGSHQKKILWPAWLLSKGLAVSNDDKRKIVCYGSGWQLEVNIEELVEYDPSLTYKYKRLGGGLYAEAFVEAEARRILS